MNILFDLISIQNYPSGGGEYVKRVFSELLKTDVFLYGLYDSQIFFLDNDKTYFKEKCEDLVDLNKLSIGDCINRYNINVFFIGIIQRFSLYDLSNISCKTIAVMHDIGDIEITSNRLNFHFSNNLKNWMRINLDFLAPKSLLSSFGRTLKTYNNLVVFLKSKNVKLVTVSEFTKNSIFYYFDELKEKDIQVLYPPEKISFSLGNTERDKSVLDIVLTKKKYFLLVNVGRDNKNAFFVHNVFSKIIKKHPNVYLVQTGSTITNKNIFSFSHLSVEDLNLLYKHAQALIYPSLSEGFGYPPLEAMKHNTMILSSNVCSMPEILQSAAIYFSPFYESDLYGKIISFIENENLYKSMYTERLLTRMLELTSRQDADLEKLLQMITE